MPKKPSRSLDAIQTDYARVCAEIGELAYRRDVGIPSALAELYERAKALNLEASAARKSNPSKE